MSLLFFKKSMYYNANFVDNFLHKYLVFSNICVNKHTHTTPPIIFNVTCACNITFFNHLSRQPHFFLEENKGKNSCIYCDNCGRVFFFPLSTNDNPLSKHLKIPLSNDNTMSKRLEIPLSNDNTVSKRLEILLSNDNTVSKRLEILLSKK